MPRLFTILLIFHWLVSASLADEGPTGVWRLNSGKVTVRVSFCGGANLCATIVGLARPLSSSGKPKTDKDNPNPALRNRPIIGLQVVRGMVPSGSNQWRGKIYNADDGGYYKSILVVSGNIMTLKGCWGPFCKKNRFVRVN